MTGEVTPPIDRAWSHIPGRSSTVSGRGAFTRHRIDRITQIAAAVGCFVLGLQSFLLALSSPAGVTPFWQPILFSIVFVSLALMCGACMFEATARYAAGAFALIYVVVLLLWPVFTEGSVGQASPEPWTWYLVNVATMAAVISFPQPLQIVWTVATPLLYGATRLSQGDFAPDFWLAVGFEVPYSLILGSVLLLLAVVFRRMASGVDRERAVAVTAYAKAAEAEAEQHERVAVSALMHDSVLAALIAAERADGPRAQSLAVSMAREAMEGLADTGLPRVGVESRAMTLRGVARGIQTALAELGVRAQVHVDEVEAPHVPGVVAAAMVRAATQAVANAVQHADGVGLEAHVSRPDDAPQDVPAVQVVVQDRGSGFDLSTVPDDRLGISASIVARVQAVGGTAQVRSSPEGTVVTMRWTGA